MSAVFVTATGTDIGKTFVTAGLIRELRRQGRAAEALKPVASGFDMGALATTDTGILLDAMGRDLNPVEAARISPWRYLAPLSPDMAARLEGTELDFAALIAFCGERIAAAQDALLIEGVGGIMSPLDRRHTVLDWMAALDLPVVLVAGSYLGTISHTLSALDVLARRGFRVAATVISESPAGGVNLAETAATITRFAPWVEVIVLPRLGRARDGQAVFRRLAELIWGLRWGLR